MLMLSGVFTVNAQSSTNNWTRNGNVSLCSGITIYWTASVRSSVEHVVSEDHWVVTLGTGPFGSDDMWEVEHESGIEGWVIQSEVDACQPENNQEDEIEVPPTPVPMPTATPIPSPAPICTLSSTFIDDDRIELIISWEGGFDQDHDGQFGDGDTFDVDGPSGVETERERFDLDDGLVYTSTLSVSGPGGQTDCNTTIDFSQNPLLEPPTEDPAPAVNPMCSMVLTSQNHNEVNFELVSNVGIDINFGDGATGFYQFNAPITVQHRYLNYTPGTVTHYTIDAQYASSSLCSLSVSVNDVATSTPTATNTPIATEMPVIQQNNVQGMDLDGYCQSQGHITSERIRPDAYSHVCRAQDNTFLSIDMRSVCAWQYQGSHPYVSLGNSLDPGSWACNTIPQNLPQYGYMTSPNQIPDGLDLSCPAGHGSRTRILPGDYDAGNLTDDERLDLWELFGEVGNISIGYGGKECLGGHVKGTPKEYAPQAPPSGEDSPQGSSNNWEIGSLVGLCNGTHIYPASNTSQPAHTIVPEDNWMVTVIDGPRDGQGYSWWDISRSAGGTGWVIQSEADCGSVNVPDPPSLPPPSDDPDPVIGWSSAPTSSGIYAKVIVNGLRIRTGPSIEYPTTGFLLNGHYYLIVEESGNWGRIATPTHSSIGWSFLTNYTQLYEVISDVEVPNPTQSEDTEQDCVVAEGCIPFVTGAKDRPNNRWWPNKVYLDDPVVEKRICSSNDIDTILEFNLDMGSWASYDINSFRVYAVYLTQTLNELFNGARAGAREPSDTAPRIKVCVPKQLNGYNFYIWSESAPDSP